MKNKKLVQINENIEIVLTETKIDNKARSILTETQKLCTEPAERQKKIRINKIWIKATIDDSPDTSFMGKYSAKPEPWAIDRKRMDFVAKIAQRERIIEKLRDWIDYADENQKITPEMIVRLETRIEKIEKSFPLEAFLDRNSCEYFIPYAGGEKPGTKDFRKYAWQDFKRMEQYNNSDFCYLGISAHCEIIIGETCQDISSGGLWGIESDCKDYCEEVAKEQLEELKSQLSELGIGKRAIEYAINQADLSINY